MERNNSIPEVTYEDDISNFKTGKLQANPRIQGSTPITNIKIEQDGEFREGSSINLESQGFCENDVNIVTTLNSEINQLGDIVVDKNIKGEIQFDMEDENSESRNGACDKTIKACDQFDRTSSDFLRSCDQGEKISEHQHGSCYQYGESCSHLAEACDQNGDLMQQVTKSCDQDKESSININEQCGDSYDHIPDTCHETCDYSAEMCNHLAEICGHHEVHSPEQSVVVDGDKREGITNEFRNVDVKKEDDVDDTAQENFEQWEHVRVGNLEEIHYIEPNQGDFSIEFEYEVQKFEDVSDEENSEGIEGAYEPSNDHDDDDDDDDSNEDFIPCQIGRDALDGQDHDDIESAATDPEALSQSSETGGFMCDICFKIFKTRSGFQSHQLSNHKQRKYCCSNCDAVFKYKKDFFDHMCNHFNLVCQVCGKQMNDLEALMRHEKIHTGRKPFECDVCGKRFLEKGNLDTHKRIHSKVKPYKCDHCDKTFSDPSNRNRHEKTHYGQEISKAHLCKYCGERFTRTTSLYRHYFRMHKGDEAILNDDLAVGDEKMYPKEFRKHSCNYCNKKFGKKETLERHELLHTECQVEECGICLRPFSSKQGLTEHLVSHHHVPECSDINLACKLCGETFKRHDTLVSHIRRHENPKPFACKQCPTRFTLKNSLVRHERKHSGIRPHACDVCGKRFLRGSDVTVHKRTHTNEKPFVCQKCGHEFRAKSNCTKHQRNCDGRLPRRRAKKLRKTTEKEKPEDFEF